LSRRRCSELCLIGLLLALLAGSAHAQRDDVAAYKQAVDRGAEAFATGDYPQARAAFEAAYRIHPEPVLLFNIASSFRREGKRKRAIKAYTRFLDEAEPGDPRIDLAVETIDALEEAIAARETAEKMEAEAARAEAARDRAEREAAARRSENARLRANLRAKQSPPPPSSSGRTLRRVGLGFGAVGALSIGLSLYDARRARNAERALEGVTSWEQRDSDLYREGQAAGQRAVIAGVAGAALVGTGAVLYLLGRRAGESRRVEVGPTVGDGAAGAVVSGRF
jgi:tetratricopeptide (TPR) repeat protein